MISPFHEVFNKTDRPKVSQILSDSGVNKLFPAIRHVLEKLTIVLIPLPVYMLIKGIEGIIEQESPESLASLGAVSSGFFNSLDMHSLIFLGALGLTFIVWFLTRNIWANGDDSEFSNEYEDYTSEEFIDHKHKDTH
ncbi:MAG: hypothetical protein OQL19_13945 [Gammaproteobacteria bacterium]|nr:hypothetical protein [Gammaproteobacteria bacterium]